MATLLKSLLGKTKRAIVVNGKLLCVDHSPVVVFTSDYKVIFSYATKEIENDAGDALIKNIILDFNERYAEVLAGTGVDPFEIEQFVDPFTGAIIIESSAYRALKDPRLHSLDAQPTKVVAQLARQFVEEYTYNYVEIYAFLFNRRICAQFMPIMIRSHFVAGLFQPLVIETEALPSPLSFGENSWFAEMFGSYNKVLERQEDCPRKVHISCVAMCDLDFIFKCGIVTQLDKRQWILIMCMILLNQMGSQRISDLTKYHNHLFTQLMRRKECVEFFSKITGHVNSARSGLSVR